MSGGSVWVFSGTSDGNELARRLSAAGHDVVLSSASAYGTETARRLLPHVTHITGGEGDAKRRAAMRKHRAKAIVDATHPFATRISQKLIDLSKDLEIPYLRFERAGAGPYPEATYAETIEEAARRAMKLGCRIFLATGSKWLREILGLEGAGAKAWFVRILPHAKALEEALDAGLSYDRICAMQGDGGKELDKALWRQWRIDCVVTRDSGDAGGLGAKAEACREMGIPLVVVKRPGLEYPWVTSAFQSILDFFETDGEERQMSAATGADPASAKNPLYPDGKTENQKERLEKK